MSRNKVGYEFCPLPRKLHPVWAGATLYVRGLIWALFELNDGGPITVTGDWLESICKQLVINGRDRPNVRKELLKLQAKGALNVSQDRVSVAFFPHDQLTPTDAIPTPVVCTTTVPTTPVVRQSHIPLESNAENDSDHVSQTDRRERRERERPDLLGFNWYCHTLNLLPTSAPAPGSWREQYAYMGGKPEAERTKVAAEIQGDPWCAANKHRVTPEHVKKNWNVYLGGAVKPVLKPLASPAPRYPYRDAAAGGE